MEEEKVEPNIEPMIFKAASIMSAEEAADTIQMIKEEIEILEATLAPHEFSNEVT